jgi:hypothetical protein
MLVSLVGTRRLRRALLFDIGAGSNQKAAGERAGQKARSGQRHTVAQGPQERQNSRWVDVFVRGHCTRRGALGCDVHGSNRPCFCLVTEFAQMGLSTSKATGPRGGEMDPRGGEAPAEAEKETMVEGVAKLAGAPICRKKVSRDRRKTPSMPAFAAGGCRYLFRRHRLVDSSSAPIPHLILLCFQVQPRRQREKSGKTQHKRKQQVLPRRRRLLFFSDTHFQGRVGL